MGGVSSLTWHMGMAWVSRALKLLGRTGSFIQPRCRSVYRESCWLLACVSSRLNASIHVASYSHSNRDIIRCHLNTGNISKKWANLRYARLTIVHLCVTYQIFRNIEKMCLLNHVNQNNNGSQVLWMFFSKNFLKCSKIIINFQRLIFSTDYLGFYLKKAWYKSSTLTNNLLIPDQCFSIVTT